MIPPHRVQVIQTLLERYNDLVDPLNGSSGVPGDGDSVVRMPRTYTPSVRELERLLRVMREHGHHVTTLGRLVPGVRASQASMRVSARGLWWHLNERYVAAGSRTVDVSVDKRGKSGKRHRVLERRVVAEVHPYVKPDKQGRETVMVRAGIQLVALGWSLKHEPMLPCTCDKKSAEPQHHPACLVFSGVQVAA